MVYTEKIRQEIHKAKSLIIMYFEESQKPVANNQVALDRHVKHKVIKEQLLHINDRIRQNLAKMVDDL